MTNAASWKYFPAKLGGCRQQCHKPVLRKLTDVAPQQQEHQVLRKTFEFREGVESVKQGGRDLLLPSIIRKLVESPLAVYKICSEDKSRTAFILSVQHQRHAYFLEEVTTGHMSSWH